MLGNIAKKGSPALAALLGMTQSEEAEAVFGGRLAKKYSPYASSKMINLLQKGATPQEAWKQTGYFRNPVDKKERFEISDLQAKLLPEGLDEFRRPLDQRTRSSVYLDEMLDHPELFENYPELMNYPVRSLQPSEITVGTKGKYSPRSNEISMDFGRKDEEFLSTLLHEIQHGIQQREGFSSGGSPREFGPFASQKAREILKGLQTKFDNSVKMHAKVTRDLMKAEAAGDTASAFKYQRILDENHAKLLELDKHLIAVDEYAKRLEPYQQYRNLGGELESRLVQGRLKDRDPNVFPLDTPIAGGGNWENALLKSKDSLAYLNKRPIIKLKGSESAGRRMRDMRTASDISKALKMRDPALPGAGFKAAAWLADSIQEAQDYADSDKGTLLDQLLVPGDALKKLLTKWSRGKEGSITEIVEAAAGF